MKARANIHALFNIDQYPFDDGKHFSSSD